MGDVFQFHLADKQHLIAILQGEALQVKIIDVAVCLGR